MAMLLFTGLNGLGVFFLLYVLVQFWKEGQRSRMPNERDRMTDLSWENRPNVLLVKRSIDRPRVEPARALHSGNRGPSLVSRRSQMSDLQDRDLHQDNAAKAGVTSFNRVPER